MDRRKELRIQWNERKTVAGVYQITNSANNKVFVDSTRNIDSVNGQKFMLEHHSHPNRSLQADWDRFGSETFTFEVLETLEKSPDEYYDVKGVLKKLKDKWLQRLQPFEDRGYNR